MNQRFRRYSVFLVMVLVVVSCRQAKYVPDGRYLHKKNEILFETINAKGDTVYKGKHDHIYAGEMYDLIRPATNKRIKLFFYNRIDTSKHRIQLTEKHEKDSLKNVGKLKRENEINEKRIQKAREKGKDTYSHKTKKLKTVRNGWRHWVATKLGEPPVLFDTAMVSKSNRQLDIYMDKRGFFDATVRDTVVFNDKKKKAYVTYTVTPRDPYFIDSLSLAGPGADANMRSMYNRFIKDEKMVVEVGDLVDEDQLQEQRYQFAKYCRDEAAFFEFNETYITFLKDTMNGRGHDVHIIMEVAKKEIPHPTIKDSIVRLPHRTHYVRKVTFYLNNPDTSSFIYGFEAYKKRCEGYGLYGFDTTETGVVATYKDEFKRYYLLDTLNNIDTVHRWFGKGDSIVNKGYFIYNDVPFLDPDLIDKQNFLYIPHYAKEYYLERTYRTMLQLDVFSSITPKIIVDPADPFGINVHVSYQLVPAPRQTFTIEPRLTNSNSILGVMGSVNYTNKNMFRGAQKIKLSFEGGFESQPLIIAADGAEGRVGGLNTYEFGPNMELTFPRLVPLPKKRMQLASKRAYPSTVFLVGFNYQKRQEFSRRLANFSYQWSFKVDKTMQYKLKLVSFNFVKLDKTPEFAAKLSELNDPFLQNSYADHFSVFNEIEFFYNNQRKDNTTGKFIHDYKVSLIQSGGILNATGIGSNNLTTDTTGTIGLKQIFGVPFTQFVRIDNQYVFNWKINKKNKFAARFLGGYGWAYGNSPSLPYEQSFYAGGSNDMRAFAPRSMAPGGMPVDTNATSTQIGDMRLETNLEYRFYMTDILEGAFFVDMGNIWKVKNDTTTTLDDPAMFAFDSFWRQVGIGTGFGIRADFDFLIVRCDMSFALHNPSLPAGERWFGTPHPIYDDYWDLDGDDMLSASEMDRYRKPFPLRFNVGIGYPF